MKQSSRARLVASAVAYPGGLLRGAAWLCALLAVVGCRGTTIHALSEHTYPSHDARVCILERQSLPAGLQVEEIAEVTVKPRSYGGDRKAKLGLAKVARKLGADAVVDAQFDNVMGGPEGTGRAVRYLDRNATPPTECQWY